MGSLKPQCATRPSLFAESAETSANFCEVANGKFELTFPSIIVNGKKWKL